MTLRQRSVFILIVIGTLPSLGLVAGSANDGVEVVVAADLTAAGKKIPPPSVQYPTYYLPILEKFQSEGPLIEGEVEPDPREVAHVVAQELAAQGYRVMDLNPNLDAQGEVIFADRTAVTVPPQYDRGRPMVLNQRGNIPLTAAMLHDPAGDYSVDNPKPPLLPNGAKVIDEILRTVDSVHGAVASGSPTQVLAIYYGYVNPDIPRVLPDNFSLSQLTTQPDLLKGTFKNQNEMLGLVAGSKGNTISREFDEHLIQGTQRKRYFVLISAFDYHAWVKSRKRVVLWQSKMSVDATRVADLSKVLHPLVDSGGPSFGRQLDRPQIIQMPAVRNGKVDVGSPVVVPTGSSH
jgi:hypothetical protein